MLVFGQISTGNFITLNLAWRNASYDESSERLKDEDSMLSYILDNYEIAGIDIDSFFVSNSPNDSTLLKLKNNDEFTLTWDNGSITGLDFSIEDAKGYISTSIDKALIDGSGAASTGQAEFTFTVMENDGITTDTSYNEIVYINGFVSGIGNIKQKVVFSSGVGSFLYKKDDCIPFGKAIFPIRGKYADDGNTLIIKNSEQVEIYRG